MLRRFVVLALLSLVIWPRAVAAQTCFPADKTPFCYDTPFEAYWQANGGLAVFGYPITAAANETNRDTGQTYLTQWAERNRFEVHPENAGTPYAILLGRLGADRLAQLGRANDPRESGPKDGCLWFEQTGHNVCNQQGSLGFKSYWQSHGLQIDGLDSYARSLQLFGLPLTAPQMETNAAGDTVLTQWFERARFEWHPNEPDEFKVLLGLLGREVASASPPPVAPPPAPTPTPAPAPANTVTLLSHSSYTSSTGSYWIVGEVRNDTASNVQYAKVVASYYDASNNLIATDSGYSAIDILTPGQRSPFDILLLDPPAGIDHYSLQVTWDTTNRQPLHTFTLSSISDRPASIDDWRYITGQVRNDTGKTVQYVEIIATLYNNDGVVVQTDFTFAELDELAPGQTSPFELLVSGWHGAARYELQVQALAK